MTDQAFARQVLRLWAFDDPAGSAQRSADAAAAESDLAAAARC